MSGILALVDGSDFARSVCGLAGWIAGRTGLGVELMHVLGRREGGAGRDLSGAIALGSRTALLDELAALDAKRAGLARARGWAILEDAAAALAEGGVEAATELRRGDLTEAVVERGADAAMLIIGKRGEASDFARGHLGSNTERVARASQAPVVVASRDFEAPRSVLLAFDGREGARRAVAHVAQGALYEGLPVTVATVGAETDAVTRALAEARATLEAAGREVRTLVLPGAPDEALGALIEREGLGMVVMGAYGGGRLRRLVIGSTTAEVVRACRVPVALIR